MKQYRILYILSALIIAAGIIVGIPSVYFSIKNTHTIAQTVFIPIKAVAPVVTPDLLTGKPVRILIPALHIDLSVADGNYNPDTKAWTLTKNKAHYAVPSVQPNNHEGNTLIYAHSYKEVFGRLDQLKVNETVTVYTDKNTSFTYALKDTKAVDPTNVDIFLYKGKPRLTLQTCSGVYLQNRQFFFFDLVEAKILS